MNWSTRLRRWVRIRTPPVRVASMKPTAATVLPAPVACSNQKRRAAPGSSGASSTTSSSSSGEASDQSCGSSSSTSSGASSSSMSSGVGVVADRDFVGVRLVGADFAAAQLDPRLGGADLLLGHQLGERPGQRVDLVRGKFGAVAQGRRVGREEALQPEQQREVAPPLDRGLLAPRLELGQGRVEPLPAGGAGSERLGPLAVEQEGLAGELGGTLDIGAGWDCRAGGNVSGVGHRRLQFLPRPQQRRDDRERGWNEAAGVGTAPRELRWSANREPNVAVL